MYACAFRSHLTIMKPKIKRLTRTQAVILPEFLSLYSKAFCSIDSHSIVEYANSLPDVRACVENMVVPPLEQQSAILQSLHRLAMLTDVANFEGPLVRLLVDGDRAPLRDLMDAIIQYNTAMDNLHALLQESAYHPAEIVPQ